MLLDSSLQDQFKLIEKQGSENFQDRKFGGPETGLVDSYKRGVFETPQHPEENIPAIGYISLVIVALTPEDFRKDFQGGAILCFDQAHKVFDADKVFAVFQVDGKRLVNAAGQIIIFGNKPHEAFKWLRGKVNLVESIFHRYAGIIRFIPNDAKFADDI